VELLVAITIIGMLAAIVLGAVQMARESAREANTRSLINKIDQFVMARYESYRSRRLPLSRAEIEAIALAQAARTNRPEWLLPYDGRDPRWPQPANAYEARARALAVARIKVNALRDLMRMEMPDRWSDVSRGPIFLPSNNSPHDWPALTQRYLGALNSASPFNTEAGSAECLYQIVMSCPGAKGQFRDTHTGDVDEDGLREFHDAWGNPIEFIRWPVGFVDYDNLKYHNDVDAPARDQPWEPPAGREDPPGPTLDWSPPSGIQSGDIEAWAAQLGISLSDMETEPDPFDPARVIDRLVDLWIESSGAVGILPMGRSYAVYPLIYSAGPDGRYEINQGRMPDSQNPGSLTQMTYHKHWEWWTDPSNTPDGVGYGDLNPFLPDRTYLEGLPDASGVYERRYVGQPRDARGYFADGVHVDGQPSRSLDHYDNIHNHEVEAE
jgi:type II secretory pathway pseudopilin PulG